MDFLVDSGADVSVFPTSAHSGSSTPCSTSLQAANGTSIPTAGTVTRELHFRNLKASHKFFLADIPRPILGADFFSKHDLLIDLRSQRLLRCPQHDSPLLAPLVPVPARATAITGDICGLHSPGTNPVENILRHFPAISVSSYDDVL